MAEADYLAGLVRKADPDRYLSTLYAPEDRRGALFSLYAFDAEIARVRDVVSEPMPGEIRLQWWRDVLAGEPEAAAGHPIAAPLVSAIRDYRLPVQTFLDYLETRTFDLYDDPMPGRTELEGYCGETASAIVQLAALVLDPAEAMRHAALAGHAGCAMGIARLVRLMPIHRARGQCYIPAELLSATGLDRESYLAASDAGAMTAAVSAMVALAREHLAAFERGAHDLPAALRPAYLPLATLSARLDRIDARKAWTSASPDISFLRRHWLLLRHAPGGWRKL